MEDNSNISNGTQGVPCTPNLGSALAKARELARADRSEFVTPEYFCKSLFAQDEFCGLISVRTHDTGAPLAQIESYIFQTSEKGLEDGEDPELSYQMRDALKIAANAVLQSGADAIDVPHVLFGILNQQDSYAHEWLTDNTGMGEPELLTEAFKAYTPRQSSRGDDTWRQYCRRVEPFTGIVGRDAEVSRAVMIMCRRERNNPILVGEPGVGKTAIVGAVAARIEAGLVPARLKGCRMYSLDVASILAGAQFRGELEDRLQRTMSGLSAGGPCIVVIDNIHEIIGTGKANDGAVDASGILMPYMQDGRIAFIGTTTFDEYKKSVGKTRSVERMFRRIDVDEPTEEETVKILRSQRPRYEEFHKVKFEDDAIRHAVKTSMRCIADRRLPEKALDLLDEAGAYREMHPAAGKTPGKVDCALIDEVAAKVTGVDLSGSSDASLATLRDRLLGKIYGQDGAVDAVCEAVYSSRAGLSDPRKPMASFLFVGPTGVGKTQLANELGAALGLPVQRFDMSEYTEKHTVSKLIGAPAGYVGYDEGGLLTDAVRKTPNCVVLLDEIEKAHQDIYNLLLQVMDYGTMTDAKGQKADFRGVVLIMTSNAGARFASQPSIGFGAVSNAGAVMGKEVKNVFAPEFLNRLTSTVVFNDMTREMAALIVDAKLADLDARLKDRGVQVRYTAAARERLLELGYSKEYGAREIERTVGRCIRPVLVNEILFGFLKDGGSAEVGFEGGEFTVKEA